jgi:DNA-binding CsgD family transcriptional regulator
MAHALATLAAGVASSRAAIYPVDHGGQIGAGMIVLTRGPQPRAPERDRREYVALGGLDDPYSPCRHLDGSRRVMSAADLGGERRFARTRYGDFLHRAGFAHQATLFLRHAGRIVGGALLLRTPDEPDFDARDLAFLAHVQPLVETAYELALAPPPSMEREDLLRARGLSPREQDVARLAAGGASNAEIARALMIGSATVKTHLTHVYDKLEVRTRTQVAVLLGPSAVT